VKPVIAFTVGDINGIGPEIILRAASSRRVTSACRPLLIGPWPAYEYYARSFRTVPSPLLVSEPPDRLSARPRPGSKDLASSGHIAAAALRHAVRLALAGTAAAVVTGPVSKAAFARARLPFPGQTEYLKYLTGAHSVAMMLVSPFLRIGLATIHVPIRLVPRTLTRRLLEERIRTIEQGLRTDWGIRRPNLAVLGLNPHAGEGGLIGKEDRTVIQPVINRLRTGRMRISGPFPADAFFARRRYASVDAVIAMYHDQGLIPLKMLALGRGVNVSVGLPLVRTSPDHGTAYDIAGKGIADPESMIEAALCAVRLSRERKKRKKR